MPRVCARLASNGGLVTHDCPSCGRRFGGTRAYDKHLDRRRDRCKTDAHLRRLGIVPDAEGIYRRAPIDTQPPLIDKRRVSRTPQRTGRAKALVDAQSRGGQRDTVATAGAPEPAPRLIEEAS